MNERKYSSMDNENIVSVHWLFSCIMAECIIKLYLYWLMNKMFLNVKNHNFRKN